MPFAILRIFESQTGTEIMHRVTNIVGKYFAIVRNGEYFVTVETKNPDGSYREALRTEPFAVQNGIINDTFGAE